MSVRTDHLAETESIERDLAEVRRLIERNRVEEARSLVSEMERRWPNVAAIQRYARVLAPPHPRLRPDRITAPLDREHAWLDRHARQFPGCWIAVVGDQLMAASPDLEVVLARLRQTAGMDGGLLYYQPAEDE